MTLPLHLERKRKALVKILRQKGVYRAGIFGSYARGQQSKTSDVDILVKTKKGMSLYDFAGIKVAAEELLGKKVDLVEYSLIKSRLRGQILKEEVRIL